MILVFIIIFDEFIFATFRKRKLIASTDYPLFNYSFWVISCSILFIMATSTGYFISADGDGSGIPEMKTVLSGIAISRYFSFEALIAKMVGLFCCLVGGKL